MQRLFVWSGMAAVTLFFLGFVLSGFIPPPSPSWTMEAVAAHYRSHATGIRIGMTLMMISGMFVPPLVAVISAQMRRIPGAHPVLVYGQLSAGTLGAVFFIVAPVIFLVASFRPERSLEITYMLNDMGWLMAVVPWSPAFMQNVIIGLAVLRDRSATPLFPRWLAFVNFWVAAGFVPTALLPFFKSGPFAWNGIFVFWLAGSVFIVWFILMTVVLLKVIAQQQRTAPAA